MRYLLVLLAFYGGYLYVTEHFELHGLHDVVVFAKKHPNPTVAPVIDYYAGIVYYQRAKYPQAQEAFTQLLQDYPTAQYMPSALVELEDAAEYNRDWDTARTACQKYVDDYSGDSDIELMRKRLELLNYEHPGP